MRDGDRCMKSIQSVFGGAQRFDKVFGRFFIALLLVKPVCIGPPGVAVDFDPVAVAFTGQPGDIGFELAADAVVAGGIADREIADAREVASERDLRDEVEGNKGDDLCVEFVDENGFIRVGRQALEIRGEVCRRVVAELGDQIFDGGKISWLRLADHAIGKWLCEFSMYLVAPIFSVYL